jgi:septal ring factor EnvC (AmiA/AmiB activator)
MLKKMSSLLLLLAFAVSIALIAGCGPKGAPQEMLDELEELKAATEACEAKVKANEARMKDMEAEIKMKESKIEMLTQERDELKAKLGIVK